MSDPGFVRDVQRLLGVPSDGVVGPQTLRALQTALAAKAGPRKLRQPETFFAEARGFLGALRQPQVDGFNVLLAAMGAAGWSTAWAAYGLATAWHETAKTMQPIAEYGKGEGRPYGAKDETGRAPYGRGYVQLTWRANYVRAAKEVGEPQLAVDYDVAMQPDIAARILVSGMSAGWFSGKGLPDYLPDELGTADQFINARRIINGTDRAPQIANYATQIQRALVVGGWA